MPADHHNTTRREPPPRPCFHHAPALLLCSLDRIGLTNPTVWGPHPPHTRAGLANLDATLDYAFEHMGLDKATEVVLTGVSAGGLATYLHADRVAAAVRSRAPTARVTALPKIGFFLVRARGTQRVSNSAGTPACHPLPSPPFRDDPRLIGRC